MTDAPDVSATESSHDAWARGLLGSVRDVLLVRDADGLITYCSPTAQTVLGYAPETLVGTPERRLIHPADVALHDMMAQRLLETGTRVAPTERRLRHADGSWRWMEVTETNLLEDDAVRGIVTNARDVTLRKAVEDDLIDLTLHDPLTGLPNRTALLDRLAVALLRSARARDEVAVLFCDLDGFKEINDGLSHRAGDLALIEVADRLRRSCRRSDTVARIGGDEFVIVCEGLHAVEGAAAIAAVVRDSIERPLMLDGVEASISVSIGIVVVEGISPPMDPVTVLRNADLAMYCAKQRGKGRWHFFDDSLTEEAALRTELEGELQNALTLGQLVVHYQPIYELGSRRVAGAEALLRWKHPQRGMLLPRDFLAIAEDTALIVPIGSWVLREACEQAGRWRRELGWNGFVSVNLSARQIADPDLSADVTAAVSTAGLEPGTLSLELNETALNRAGHAAVAQLADVQAHGVHLGVDDFGTGHASLTNLQRLPFDFMKIHRTFVERLDPAAGRRARSNAIVSVLVQLGSALGLRTIAQGIESDDEARLLQKYGCPFGQGDALARVAPAETHAPLVAAASAR